MEPADLIRRREALGLTAPQLARELDVAESSVYRWESGKVPLHGPTAVGVDTILKGLEDQKHRRASPPPGGRAGEDGEAAGAAPVEQEERD